MSSAALLVSHLAVASDAIEALEPGFAQALRDQGVLLPVAAGPGRWAGLIRLLFTTALVEGSTRCAGAHDRRWCYNSPQEAIGALDSWILAGFNGEPQGWHRSVHDGRRRTDGDAEREYRDGEVEA